MPIRHNPGPCGLNFSFDCPPVAGGADEQGQAKVSGRSTIDPVIVFTSTR